MGHSIGSDKSAPVGKFMLRHFSIFRFYTLSSDEACDATLWVCWPFLPEILIFSIFLFCRYGVGGCSHTHPLLGCQQPGGFIQAPEVVALIKLGVTFLVIYLALTVLWLVLQSQILFGSRAFPYRYVCISPVLSLFLLSLGWFSPSPLALFSFFWDSFPLLSPFG